MKLIMAVLNADDAETIASKLAMAGYSSTRMESRGGFTDMPNMTLFIGVEDMKAREVLGLIQSSTSPRDYAAPMPADNCAYTPPAKVKSSGAVIFVYEVEHFIKL